MNPVHGGLRLLAVVAHPDDEAWAHGGTLAACTAGGATVRVLCATRGEAGVDRLHGTASGEALASLRSGELEQSCALLGAPPPIHLDLPDGGLHSLRQDEGVAALLPHLEGFAPHAVLTLGPDGGYGHLDHLAITAWLGAAVESLGPAGPRLLHTVFPSGLLHPVWRGLRRAGFAGVPAEPPPGGFGVPRSAVDLPLSVSPWRETKRAAVGAHASQLRDGQIDSFLRPGLLESLLEEEWLTVAAGPPLPALADHPLQGLRP